MTTQQKAQLLHKMTIKDNWKNLLPKNKMVANQLPRKQSCLEPRGRSKLEKRKRRIKA